MMRLFSIAMLAGVLLLGSGCVRFPYGYSGDRHNFVSTEHQPLSLALTDTVTGETLWTLDVPVGKMAVIDLEHKTDWVPAQSPALPAEKIYWDLFDPGAILGSLRHEQALSGRPVILKVTVREDQTPAGDGAASPMVSAAMPAAPRNGPATPVAPAADGDPNVPAAVPPGPAVR